MEILTNISNEMNVVSSIREQLFNVEKVQLVPCKEGFNVPQAFGMYKQGGGDPLGVVGKDFTATQPVALLDGLVGCGLDLSKMSYSELKGGSKIFFDIPAGQINFRNLRGQEDTTNVSVRVQTGFDGWTSTSLYIYTYRLVCANGMKATVTEFKAKFKNTSGNQGKALSLCHDVGMAIENLATLEELYLKLDKIQVNQTIIDDYLKKVANIDKAIKDEWSTRKLNMYNDIMGSIDLEFSRTGATAYGLLQGITHYTNHKASGSGSDEYILLDTGAKMNDKAMNYLKALV